MDIFEELMQVDECRFEVEYLHAVLQGKPLPVRPIEVEASPEAEGAEVVEVGVAETGAAVLQVEDAKVGDTAVQLSEDAKKMDTNEVQVTLVDKPVQAEAPAVVDLTRETDMVDLTTETDVVMEVACPIDLDSAPKPNATEMEVSMQIADENSFENNQVHLDTQKPIEAKHTGPNPSIPSTPLAESNIQ